MKKEILKKKNSIRSKTWHWTNRKGKTLCGIDISESVIVWKKGEGGKKECQHCAKKIMNDPEVKDSIKEVLESIKTADREKGRKHTEFIKNCSTFPKGDPQEHEVINQKLVQRRRDLESIGYSSEEAEGIASREMFDLFNGIEEIENEDKHFPEMAQLINAISSVAFVESRKRVLESAISALRETFNKWQDDCIKNNHSIPDFEYFYRVMRLRNIIKKFDVEL